MQTVSYRSFLAFKDYMQLMASAHIDGVFSGLFTIEVMNIGSHIENLS